MPPPQDTQHQPPGWVRLRSARTTKAGQNWSGVDSSLNAAQSNAEWATKKPALGAHSLLPINLDLQNYPVWDEAAIKRRGEDSSLAP